MAKKSKTHRAASIEAKINNFAITPSISRNKEPMKNSALKKLGPPLRVKTDVDSFGELNSAKKTTTQLFQKNKEISIKDYSQKRNYDASEKRRDRSLENNKNEIILKTPILSQPKSALKSITNKLEKSKMPLKSIKTTNRKIDFEQNLKNSRERAKSPNYFNRKKVNFLKLETEIRIKKPVNKLSPQKEARASASVAQPTSSTGRSKKRSRERSMTLQTLMGIFSKTAKPFSFSLCEAKITWPKPKSVLEGIPAFTE